MKKPGQVPGVGFFSFCPADPAKDSATFNYITLL